MKILKKVCLTIFATIVLIISILLLLIAFNIMDSNVFGILISKVLLSQEGTYALVGVSVVLILLAMWCLFFCEENNKNGKNSGIELENSDGRLLITKNTLQDLVKGVINNFPSIEDSEANVLIDRENNVTIDVTITVSDGAIIKDVSSKLQNDIKSIVRKSTDLELDKVNIVVKKVEKEEKSKNSVDD